MLVTAPITDVQPSRRRGVRLDVRVAVRLDCEMLLASVGRDLSELGRECLARARIRDLDAEDGGASAVVADPDRGLLGVRVGVVNGVLTGECDCVDGVPGCLCGHAVAVALKALEMEFTFSSISSRARGVDPAEQRFAEIAAELTPRVLIGLVARQAAADRYFAASLLACAGRLPPAGTKEIHAARAVIAAAADVPSGRRWDLYHLVKAGRTMVAELHLRLCQAPDPEPLELAARLAKLVGNADVETFLDLPEGYADILGAEGIAEFEALLTRRPQ